MGNREKVRERGGGGERVKGIERRSERRREKEREKQRKRAIETERD